MAARERNILACSGGFNLGTRGQMVPGPLVQFAIELSGRRTEPRVCFIGTATGDNPVHLAGVYGAFVSTDVRVSHLALFPMPNVDDVRVHMLSQDVIWVGGGSVSGLLAVWRLHGLDVILQDCWESGIVLAGDSAGSLCWHTGGVTDSFGPELEPFTNGLAFLPCSNGVHFDSQSGRRPLYHRLVAEGVLPPGYATDNGVGLHYRGVELVEVVAEREAAAAYRVDRGSDGRTVERMIEPRLLASRSADARRPGQGG